MMNDKKKITTRRCRHPEGMRVYMRLIDKCLSEWCGKCGALKTETSPGTPCKWIRPELSK